MDRAQTHRETSLHASESDEARFGGLYGTLELEQFPRLFPGRGRSSASQRVGCAEDEDPTSGRIRRSRTVSAVRHATLRLSLRASFLEKREVAHPSYVGRTFKR